MFFAVETSKWFWLTVLVVVYTYTRLKFEFQQMKSALARSIAVLCLALPSDDLAGDRFSRKIDRQGPWPRYQEGGPPDLPKQFDSRCRFVGLVCSARVQPALPRLVAY